MNAGGRGRQPYRGDSNHTVPYRVGVLERAVDINDGRIDSLEDWRSELRGAYNLVRITLGVSLLSSVVAITALVVGIMNGGG